MQEYDIWWTCCILRFCQARRETQGVAQRHRKCWDYLIISSSKTLRVCVCESNSVPKRSKLLSWEFSWCSCRGTQEAHRAVSNEALYGVFRISGLITLTYLHLWNCWQAVLILCFPALVHRTPSPHTIIIAFDQFLPRSFLFSLFNCFTTGVSQVFSALVLCLNLLLTEYKRSRCFFPSLKLHSLWQAINGHSDALVTQKRMWKQCIQSSWLIKCVSVCVCHSLFQRHRASRFW